MAEIDKGLLSAINKLRGVGGRSQNADATEISAESNAAAPLEGNTAAVSGLSQGSPENMQALSNFLNSSAAQPVENVEKKYTMEDLDNFINSFKKTE